MIDKRAFLASSLGALGACAAQRGQYPGHSIDENALRAHMEFLADDALEGREAGTRGYDLAALYVAAQYRALGLEPAGTRGYFQVVPMRQSVLDPGSVRMRFLGGGSPIELSDADHVLAYPSLASDVERIEGDTVFAGNGVVAPTLNRDDFAGLDVNGKIVVVLGGPAPGLPAETAAHLGAASTQAARANERGALGLIIIWTPIYEQRLAFARFATLARQSRIDWYDPRISRYPGGSASAAAFLNETGATMLFRNAPRTYAEVIEQAATRPVSGFSLNQRVQLSQQARLSNSRSANVAGLLRGSDPRLRDETIVVICHLDHVGIGPAVAGDTIYNGALDNASGVAATLEVARHMRARRPRRSVLFLAVTAEEKGLVGSDYFARAPTIPRERLVGAINLDGVMAFFDFHSVIGYGADSSTLREPLHRAAQSLGLTLLPDPRPELSIFTRSDHYSFVTQGIPAIFLQIGDGRAADGGTGLAFNEAWDRQHLHQPSDDIGQPIDYGVFARFTDLYARFTLESANMAEAPRWYNGDFFGDNFAADAPKAPRVL